MPTLLPSARNTLESAHRAVPFVYRNVFRREPSYVLSDPVRHATMTHSQVPKGQHLDADRVSSPGAPLPRIAQAEATSHGGRLTC